MDMPVDEIPTFESTLFVLNSSGFVLHCNDDASDRLSCPTPFIKGEHFKDVLLSINPRWKDWLPDVFDESCSGLFLPWIEDQHKLPGGIKLNVLSADEQVVVSVEPALAPDQELAEASFHDLSTDLPTVARLFLRMRTAESHLHNYMYNFPGVFFSQRPDFSFAYLGGYFSKLVGLDTKQLLRNGNLFFELMVEEDRDVYIADLERHSKSGKTFTITYRMRHPKMGHILYIMDVRTPKLSPAGLLLGYEGVWIDVTRQTIAENRLRRTAWKESLAVITSGLVHDFSNMMAGIFSLSELYVSSLEEEHPWKLGMSQIMNNSREARKLVRRIIDLNREIEGQPSYYNLENIVKEQLDLMEVILPKQCSVDTEFSEQELPVYMDDVSFRQMLLNMAMNSKDVIGRSGGIRICVSKVEAGSDIFEGTYGGVRKVEREGAIIAFSDTGNGISEEHISKIFDPFFTTKEALKGSGFGLYNAQLFVFKCKGLIDVKSEIGVGTTFYIYLPLADFTEEEESHELVEIEETGPRPRIALYSAKDPQSLDLVHYIQQKEWELITFIEPSKALKYLKEPHFSPNILLIVSIGDDAKAEQLLLAAAKAHPDIRRVLFVMGRNLDEISPRVRSLANVLIDANQRMSKVIEKVEDIL